MVNADPLTGGRDLARGEQLLEGLRVLGPGPLIAGPFATRIMAGFGLRRLHPGGKGHERAEEADDKQVVLIVSAAEGHCRVHSVKGRVKLFRMEGQTGARPGEAGPRSEVRQGRTEGGEGG